MRQQTYSRSISQQSGPSMKHCIINLEEKQEIAKHMRNRFQILMRQSNNHILPERNATPYYIDSLKVPDTLLRVVQKRLNLLSMIGYKEQIAKCDNERYLKLIKGGVTKILNGEHIVKAAFLQMVEELCLKYLQNPGQCMAMITKVREQDRVKLKGEDPRTIQIIVQNYFKSLQREWDDKLKQMKEVMNQNHKISLREQLQRFMIVQKQLLEFNRIKMFNIKIADMVQWQKKNIKNKAYQDSKRNIKPERPQNIDPHYHRENRKRQHQNWGTKQQRIARFDNYQQRSQFRGVQDDDRAGRASSFISTEQSMQSEIRTLNRNTINDPYNNRQDRNTEQLIAIPDINMPHGVRQHMNEVGISSQIDISIRNVQTSPLRTAGKKMATQQNQQMGFNQLPTGYSKPNSHTNYGNF